MATLIKKVFRCRHDQADTPLTCGPSERPPAAFRTSTKVICLDCGQELPFGWNEVALLGRDVLPYEAMAILSSTIAES